MICYACPAYSIIQIGIDPCLDLIYLDFFIPNNHFPKINDRREVEALNFLLRGVVWVVALGLPILLALILQVLCWISLALKRTKKMAKNY